MKRTVTITDATHELYGRIAVIVRETHWYTHVRPLYFNVTHILTKDQYMANELEER